MKKLIFSVIFLSFHMFCVYCVTIYHVFLYSLVFMKDMNPIIIPLTV